MREKIPAHKISEKLGVRYTSDKRLLLSDLDNAAQVATTATMFLDEPALKDNPEMAEIKKTVNWEFLERLPPAIQTAEFMPKLFAYHQAYIQGSHTAQLSVDPDECRLVFSTLYHLTGVPAQGDTSEVAAQLRVNRHAIETMFANLGMGMMSADEVAASGKQLQRVGERAAGLAAHINEQGI
jgi:hypothetical protein